MLACLFVPAQLKAAVLSARRRRRAKQRLSAVVDSQCFIALMDSVIAFLNGALRAGGRPPDLRSEQAFFFFLFVLLIQKLSFDRMLVNMQRCSRTVSPSDHLRRKVFLLDIYLSTDNLIRNLFEIF